MRRNNILENVTYEEGMYRVYETGSKEGTIVSAEGRSYSRDCIPVTPGKQYVGFDVGITNITTFDSEEQALENYVDLEKFVVALNRGLINPATAYFRMTIWTGAEDTVKLFELEPWEKAEVTVGRGGTFDFDSILKANLATWDSIEPTVIVQDGTYDIIEEFKEVYGGNFFDSKHYKTDLTKENTANKEDDFRYYTGIFLQNNAKYIFQPGAEVVCRTEDDMSNEVAGYFSPFNVRSGEIIGLHLTARNTRYCIHDDFGQAGSLYNKHYFKGCIIKCEGSGDRESGYDRCIGAGMSNHNDVLIENCILLCEAENANDMISYHNYKEDGKSQLIITGCYVDNGIRITHHGDSTQKSEAIIHNNSIGTKITVTYESTKYNTKNWNVTSYNNEFRESLLHVGLCRKD